MEYMINVAFSVQWEINHLFNKWLWYKGYLSIHQNMSLFCFEMLF